MKHNIVRINKIVLNNFKNVKKGIVEMPAYSGKELFSEKADVLGLVWAERIRKNICC